MAGDLTIPFRAWISSSVWLSVWGGNRILLKCRRSLFSRHIRIHMVPHCAMSWRGGFRW
jgi:hypothetical protein